LILGIFMKVPFSYLNEQFDNCDEIFDSLKKFVKTGDFTLGKPLQEFEKKYAEVVGSKYTIGVGSGTDALFLPLKALEIGHGDEVITAVNTFVATAGAIETAGAKIVFVDCNEKYVMDPSLVEAAITPKTKAIMPVHFSGQPVDMPRIMEIANKHNLHVIEDTCQGVGAKINGKFCGTYGIMSGYSVHPLKNLNVWGDGGLVATDSEELTEKLRLMRNHGIINRDEYAFYAYNSRLDTLQAVIGNHLIKDIKWITDSKIRNAKKFDDAFSGLKDVITVPDRPGNEKHVYHLYMLLVKDRDNLNSYLNEQGIESKIHYPIPLHLQQASKKLGYKEGDFPVAEAQAKSLLTLPAHQHLSQEQIEFTIDSVRHFYNS
jgi:dTDP-3-amino-2,3,6-trideoxy-4-keto-D-glucose/dTDP-3-amino-3,4,6-trideoxy-alpha-D-glucose/dTDP-2,6-dideoxy-D-kanosamine transaminase